MSCNNILKMAMGAAALTLAMGAQAGSKDVSVTVVPEKHALGKNDDLLVSVTLTNKSDSPQYVLKSRTPFEGVGAPLFDVTRDGERVPYLGALVKRTAPTQADYYVLKPGASHTVKVNLSSLYDLSVTGDYMISYRTASPDLFLAASGKKDSASSDVSELTSEPASLWIDASLPRGSEPASLQTMKKQQPTYTIASLGYTNCTASQQTSISSALSAATTMATSGVNYMNGTHGARYTKWFGALNATRESTIKSHFAAIKDAFVTKAIVVDCSCTDAGTYAYVYPTQPYKIYVCGAFWSAPMSGTDSKGGTLVHEMSHFNVVASTDDWAYGQSAAASLAISNPSQAIDNADSHEYFGENTPALN